MVAWERIFSSLFQKAVGKPLHEGILLSYFSTLRIGGPADYFFEAHSLSELKKAVALARENRVPFYVIGGGSNVLFDDEGYRGLIIKNAVQGFKLNEEKEEIEVFSGTPLIDLVRFAVETGREGLEFLAGIPGTVGGAIFGNAGAFGQSIGDYLEGATMLDFRGEEVLATKEHFHFSYRDSSLKKKHFLLLRALFKLKKGDREKSRQKMEENLKKRRERHPTPDIASAGCYFRNPLLPDGKKVSAGYLLEQVGAKEMRVGEAAVFFGHANFIINLNRAMARDILALAQELKQKVREKFGIELEEEIIFLPATFSML